MNGKLSVFLSLERRFLARTTIAFIRHHAGRSK
jgi:hypothetical protein